MKQKIKLSIKRMSKIKIQLSVLDWLIEILSWIFMSVIWIVTIFCYSKLPDIIAVHYDSAGKADGFGGKENIFTLPILAAILFAGLTILNKYPRIFNYPVKITSENALKRFKDATRLVRYLKFIAAAVFAYFILKTTRYTFDITGITHELGIWFYIAAGILILPLIYYSIRTFSSK